MEETQVSSFLKDFFSPDRLTSFQAPLDEKPIVVYIFRSPGEEPERIVLSELFPFMTIQDIKTLIYKKKGSPGFAPRFQSILIPIRSEEDYTAEEQSDYYSTAEYSWIDPNIATNVYSLKNPFTLASGTSIDSRFVASTGAKKVVGFTSRSRSTIEDILFTIVQGDEITLHVFLYGDVLNAMNPSLRQSEREWFGRLGPFFPELQPDQVPETILPEETARYEKQISYLTRSLQFTTKLQTLLEEVVPIDIALGGIKFLRIVWKSPDTDEETEESIESLFYKLPATSERPFLRILPAEGTPISKLKLQGAFLKIPEISDPRLLLQWAQERNPTPDRDFLLAKTIVRRSMGTLPAFYGTLRIFEDKSADFVLLPPKQIRKLDPRSDLSEFSDFLSKAIQDTYLAQQPVQIGEATIICGLRMPSEGKPMTKQSLRKRIAAFSSMFQEISPLPGEQPLLMLRYKMVSNFATEDRIYSFLTQLASRRVLKGEVPLNELAVSVEEEFQLTQEEAIQKTSDWFRSQGQSTLVIPETKDYIMTYNRGIDIAIFQQHPFYSFHFYRLDSKESFSRILTCLSLLFSAEDDQLLVPQRAVQELAASAAVVEESVEELEQQESGEQVAQGDDLGAEGGLDFYMDYMAMGDELEPGDAMDAAAVANTGHVNVAREVASAAPAPATTSVAAPAAAAPNENEDEEEEDTSGKKKTYAKFLARKLQEADRRLFEYKSANPAIKIKKYVTMCQATETRQPSVLSEEQYERMREVYAEDDIVFLVYPLEQDEAVPEEGTEVYTLLKYGSDPLHQNYYLCCEFFCFKDYILVREKDFYSKKDRKGNPKVGESSPGAKDKGSCPFCHGLLMKSLKDPGPNETVLQRKIKKKSDGKRHLFVRFLKDTYHPEGFYLPCCFTEDKTLHISDREFEHIRAAAQVVAPQVGDEEIPAREALVDTGPIAATGAPVSPMLDYWTTLNRTHKKYIVGPEKFPLKVGDLEGPQIGLLPSVLDAYFAQSPVDFVSREFNRMELKADARAFLRIGVENRDKYLPDSFLAAAAPFLQNRNSAAELKADILRVMTPRVFLMLNYGNLVLEFYDASLPVPPEAEMRRWAASELDVDLSDTNKYAVQRLYVSYKNFTEVFLPSTDQLKQYRQFADLFAQPGLMGNGIVFIVLDIDQEDKVHVRCPPYGFNIQQYGNCDIGFLMHHYTGVWEPIFYFDNRSARGRNPELHDPTLRFQRALEAGWPLIARRRISEFVSKCSGPGRAAFTSQQEIDPLALAPLGYVIQAIGDPAEGIVRDAYNHVVAVTFREPRGKARLVAIPVSDDGTKWINKTHLDWDDFQPSRMDDIVKFFGKTRVKDAFSLYPGYVPLRKVWSRGAKKYVAIQLANGVYIPADAAKEESVVEGLDRVEIDEMDWTLNKEIAFPKLQKESEEKLVKTQEADLEEIFQHLRFTFSRWIITDGADSLREQLEALLFTRKDLPLYEKRKRAEILLGEEIDRWLGKEGDSWPSLEDKDEQSIQKLLRVDCRVQAEASCTGRCSWRQGQGDTVGRCYLHSPKNARLGSRYVFGPTLLKMRLIEELLRFPERRQQLLKQKVSSLVSIQDAMQIHDQYILPETSLAWFDLLRLEWMRPTEEKKLFFEEMSGDAPAAPPATAAAAAAASLAPQGLPSQLKELLGAEDPKTNALYLFKQTKLANFLPPLQISMEELGLAPEEQAFTKEAMKRLVSALRQPVVQIDLRGPEPNILAFGLLRKQKVNIPYIFILTAEGPALLSKKENYYQAVLLEDMPEALFEIFENRILFPQIDPQTFLGIL